MIARIAYFWGCFVAWIVCAPLAMAVAPTGNLHQITWLVHVDMIDAGAGEDLAYYSSLIAEGTGTATDFVMGDQGPFDTPCCSKFETISVSTFGTPGDGLDVPSSETDLDALDLIVGASGSYGFLVDSLGYCSGPTSTAIGCGLRPSCSGNPNDDPPLWMIVTMEAYDSDVFGKVIAHERGHNACLSHVSDDRCQVMRSGDRWRRPQLEDGMVSSAHSAQRHLIGEAGIGRKAKGVICCREKNLVILGLQLDRALQEKLRLIVMTVPVHQLGQGNEWLC